MFLQKEFKNYITFILGCRKRVWVTELRAHRALSRFITNTCLYMIEPSEVPTSVGTWVQKGCEYTANCPEKHKQMNKSLKNNHYKIVRWYGNRKQSNDEPTRQTSQWKLSSVINTYTLLKIYMTFSIPNFVNISGHLGTQDTERHKGNATAVYR